MQTPKNSGTPIKDQSPDIRLSEKTNLKYKRSDLREKRPPISALRLDLVGLRKISEGQRQTIMGCPLLKWFFTSTSLL